MKAAFGSLALAWLLFLFLSIDASAASTVDDPHGYAGTAILFNNGSVQESENEQYARVLGDMAYRLIMNGCYHDAEGRLKQALLFDPHSVSANCNLGFILNKTGRAQEAIPYLLYAYRSAPNEPAVLQCLAASYQLCANYPTAVALYRQYIARFPQAADLKFIAAIADHLDAEELSKAANCSGSHTGAADNLNWQKHRLRVFADNGSGMKGFQPGFAQILQESFNNWAQAGVLSFEYVNEPELADIVCTWTDDPSKLSSSAEGGETVVNHRGNALTHARMTLLTNRANTGCPLTQNEVRTLCLHEIGHALGIIKHSKNPDDVMFSTLTNRTNTSSADLVDLRSHYLSSAKAIPQS